MTAFPAVVFDLGNVLIQWDPHPAISAGVGEEQARAFLASPDFDFGAWNHEQDAGRRFADSEAAAVAAYPHWRAHILAYRQHFGLSLVGEIPATVAVLRDLHAADVPLLACTNWSDELFPVALKRFDFLGVFAHIVVSGAVGLAKPDPAIYALVGDRLERYAGGRGPAQAVFVDDKAENVEAARAAGMDGVRFTGGETLRTELAARGLPV